MKVISRNSTNLLFDKADELGQQSHESWRCVHFKFSDKPEKNNQMLYNNFVVRAITDLLEDNTGYIYLCEDADIIILFQGALTPVINKLSTHFGDIRPNSAAKEDDNDLVSIFDLSRHWNDFYDLCELKYYHGLVVAENNDNHRPHAHHGVSLKTA